MTSNFITESEINETRRKRQEEWDRVRSADQPKEAPEEAYDSRSLYDRLQEQKQKKDLEYEEAHKLKNMIKGLDDDEVEYLDLVDRTKLAVERKKTLDEERELNDYRNRVANLQEKSLEERLYAEMNGVVKPKTTTARQSQGKLLKGAIVSRTAEPKKRKLSENVEGAMRCIGILPGLGCYNDSSESDLSSESDAECCPVVDMLGRKIKKPEKVD